jgi:hypothetical protein
MMADRCLKGKEAGVSQCWKELEQQKAEEQMDLVIGRKRRQRVKIKQSPSRLEVFGLW